MNYNGTKKYGIRDFIPMIAANALIGIVAGALSPIILILLKGLFSPSTNTEKAIGTAIIMGLIVIGLIVNFALRWKYYMSIKLMKYLPMIMLILALSFGAGAGLFALYFGL